MSDRSEGQRFTGFTLLELMLVVAILGMLAIVAIPSFVRYMRVAKTAEAYRLINKATKGLELYFMRSWPDANGTPQRCQFPNANADTPPTKDYCCTDGEPDGKCEPNETFWNHPSWQAMLFKIADKHYYTMKYNATGFGFQPYGNGAVVRIAAFGDLDCDGTYGEFYQILGGQTSDPNQILNCRPHKYGMIHGEAETE